MLKELFKAPALFVSLGFIIALTTSAVMLPRILVISHKNRLYDYPDERKVHIQPVPRLGGLAFMPAIFVAFALILVFRLRFGLSISALQNDATLLRLLALMVGILFLYFIGLADDLTGVGYRTKLVVQTFVASLLATSTTFLNTLQGFLYIYEIPSYIGIPLSIFTIIYITNAINLIDGIDGLSSGLGALCLVVFTALFFIEGQFFNALIAACTLGGLLPFWYKNVFGDAQKGTKIYMGDAGSLTLGFVLSYLAIHACRFSTGIWHDKFDAVVAFSILFVPLIDVVRVVVHRLRHGKSPFLPDRNHLHHKMLRMGLTPRAVMISILLYCLFFLLLNMALVRYANLNLTWVVLLDLVLWTISQGIFTLIGNRQKRREKESQS